MSIPVIPDLTAAPNDLALDAAAQALLSCIGGFLGTTYYPGDIAADNFVASGAGFESEHFREGKAFATLTMQNQDDWVGPLPFDFELAAITVAFMAHDGGINLPAITAFKATPLVLGGGGMQFSQSGAAAGVAAWSNKTALSQLVLPGYLWNRATYTWSAFGLLPAGSALMIRRDLVTYSDGLTEATCTNALQYAIAGRVRLQPY